MIAGTLYVMLYYVIDYYITSHRPIYHVVLYWQVVYIINYVACRNVHIVISIGGIYNLVYYY